ncbi:MAG: hypothetical protein K0U39_02920 [Alphaproteobacteria bacterium]|nr:hypothetical protein [Alphaproteobacteria bacterium]
MVVKTSAYELQKIFAKEGKQRGIDVPEPQEDLNPKNSWIDELDRKDQESIIATKMKKIRHRRYYQLLAVGLVASLLLIKLMSMGIGYIKQSDFNFNVTEILQEAITPTIEQSVAQQFNIEEETEEEALFGTSRNRKNTVDERTRSLQQAGITPLDQKVGQESEISNILKENIKGKAQQVSKQEQQLKTYQTVLQVTEAKLAERQAALDATRDEIKGLLEDYGDVKEGERGNLAGIYSSIEPKRAAVIFNNLDVDIVVGIINQMSHRQSAKIIGYMDPDKARQITEVLSGR